jgi:uncharacterized protein
VERLRARLLDGVPVEPADRSPISMRDISSPISSTSIVREDKAEWWEYFRLCELAEADLIDEPKAVACLEYDRDIAMVKKSVVQRYRLS